MVITLKHNLLESQHKNSLAFPPSGINVEFILQPHKKGKIGTHQLQKMGQSLRFQSIDYEFYQHDKRT